MMGERAMTRNFEARPSILLVDDEVSLLNLAARIFRNNGFDTATAVNSVEALQRVIDRPPDVVLLDLYLHDDVDGIECLKRMRSSGYQGPVLIFTGETDPEVLNKALEAGAEDFLVKPCADPTMEVVRLLEESMRRIREHEDFDRIADSGYLRTMGLSDSDVRILSDFHRLGFPDIKRLASETERNANVLGKQLQRIRGKLHLSNTFNIVKLLTILARFGRRITYDFLRTFLDEKERWSSSCLKPESHKQEDHHDERYT